MLHGFVTKPDGKVEFRFGVAMFLHYVWVHQIHPEGTPPPSWPFPRSLREQTHLARATHDVARKLERAAAHYAHEQQAYLDGLLDPNRAPDQMELSVQLDLILVYLRVLPDILAAVTPFFYEREQPSSYSFRKHVQWFTKKRPAVDPGYRELLIQHNGWFETLAGKKGLGLRDLLIHSFGTFQYPVNKARDTLSADMVTKRSYESDVDRKLSRITRGLCAFLDAYVIHFNERIKNACGWAPLSHYEGMGCKITDFDKLPPSSWLIPHS